MAGLYKTYDEIQAELTRPRSYGEDSSTGTTSGESSTGTAVAGESNITQPIQTSQGDSESESYDLTPAKIDAPAGSSPKINLRGYGGDSEISDQYRSLFAPATNSLRDSYGKLSSAADEFVSQAGPLRSWSSIQGGKAIEDALTPDEDAEKDAAEMQAAKDLLGTSYKGPGTLAQGDVDTVGKNLSSLKQSGKAYLGAPGIAAILQTQASTPATDQELAIEADRYLSNQDYLRSAQEFQKQISGLEGDYRSAQEQALGYAQRRTTDEADIANQARELLQGARGDISSELSRRVEAEKANEAAFNAAMDKYKATGDLSALAGYEGYDQAVEAFNTPTQQLYAEGKAKLAEIQGQYQDIANIPYFSPQITTRGLSTLGWTPDELKALQSQYDPKTLEALKKRATERQIALEDAGFSDSSQERYMSKYGDIRMQPNPEKAPGPGKYSTLIPELYGGELGAYQPLGTTDYVTSTDSSGLSPEALSTEAERDRYNRASLLLDLEDRMDAAETPYEKKKIATEAGKYLEDEKAALESRKEALTAKEQEYLVAVEDAHRRYRQAKRRGKWALALKVAIPVITLGTGSAIMGASGLAV
jgi:hypothetical protein